MQRYFLDRPYNSNEVVFISGDDFHHITRVMRMKEGHTICGIFPSGQSAILEIVTIQQEQVECKIIRFDESDKELPIKVTVVSGLPKGDKLEWIIQKGTELGACEFVPFIADRSIVKWDEKKAEKKLVRWRKIAKEAAEQSGRQMIPQIANPLTMRELLSYSQDFHFKIFAYEEAAKNGETTHFSSILQQAEKNQSMMIIFGPEGGISLKEKEELEKNGIVPCGFGPRILRTETAPLYALAAISYQFELLR